MKYLIKMALKLLGRFAPIDDADFDRISAQANEWAGTIVIDDANLEKKTPEHWKKISQFLNGWVVQIVIAILYIVAYDALQKMMREDKTPKQEE